MNIKNLYPKLVLFISLFLISNISQFVSAAENKAATRVDDLKVWVGKPVSDLLAHPKFGVPDKKIVVDDETVITYRQMLDISGNIQDKVVLNINCRRNFIYDNKNIIKSVSEDGTCQDTKDFLPSK